MTIINKIAGLFLLTLITAIFFNCSSSVQSLGTNRATLGYTSAIHKDLLALPKPKEKIVIAVYKFRDQTGQYKAAASGYTWSTAVTQGATSMVLKALEDSGWFVTVEREGISNLLNERKIIRSTRENYTDGNGQALPPLPPLLYAGVTMEGGIISYETNYVTGGFGAKYFGLGGSTEFRKDMVTIYLRTVATKSGRILNTVNTTKTILSKAVDLNLYRFVREKRLLEMEAGITTNEPPNMCVLEAIEKAVFSLIVEGILASNWELENPEDIKSPIIQKYLSEKESVERDVKFDAEGYLYKNNPNQFSHTKGVSFGLNIGGLFYQGDYESPKMRPAGHAFVGVGLFNHVALHLEASAGQLADKSYFNTEYVTAALDARYMLWPRNRWTPFIQLGASAVNFWVEDKDGNEISRVKTHGGWEPAAVAGIGLSYLLTPNVGLNFILSNNYLFTDQLDGIEHGDIDDSFFGGRFGFTYYFNR